MHNTLLQDDILQLLRQQDKRGKLFHSGAISNWPEIKSSLSKKAQKYRDSAKAFTFIACFSLAVAGAVCLAPFWGFTLTPDLKSGGLFIFLTLCNICSAFLHRLWWQKLQYQITLIELLIATETKSRFTPPDTRN